MNKIELLKTALKVFSEMKKNWKTKAGSIAVVVIIMLLAWSMQSCKGLWVKGDGTHNYEYEYRKEVKTNNRDYGLQNNN